MKQPKILLCIMSCNNELYKEEEKLIRNTYIKLCKTFNINYLFFDGIDSETYYDNDTNSLHLQCNDSLYYTYEKNIELFKWLKSNDITFDYLVRTNCSTFINIPLLYNYLLHNFNIYKDNRIIHIESHILDNIYMITGKFIVFNKNHIDILLNNIQEHSNQYYDDVMFCKTFQKYYNSNLDINNIEELSLYNNEYFKIIPSLYINDIVTRINYVDINNIKNYEDIKDFIVINCKPYNDNDFELIKFSINKLYNIISNNYNITNNTLNIINSYNNILFSHNQTEQHMFVFKPIFNVLIYIDINKDNYNEYINYLYNLASYKLIKNIYVLYNYEENIKNFKNIHFINNQLSITIQTITEIYNLNQNNSYYDYFFISNDIITIDMLNNYYFKFLTDSQYTNTQNNLLSNLCYNSLYADGLINTLYNKCNIMIRSNINNIDLNKLKLFYF